MTISQEAPTTAAGIEEAEESILADLTRNLGGTDAVELTEGGSPARLLRVTLADGTSHVIKLLVDLPGAVDGHDLDSFHVKIKQIKKIRAEIAELRPTYTELSQEFYGNNWAAYTMPYYPNRDIAEPLRRGVPPTERFFPDLRTILGDLVGLGYLHSGKAIRPGDVASIHGDRLSRRFWLLQKYLPAELTDAERIVINGRECRNPLELAQRVIDDRALTGAVDPPRLYYPVHGDLNTRNILVTDETGPGYRIIDPRGTTDHWDPAYDLSKILFSLTVWDVGLRKGFDVENDADLGRWQVSLRGGNYPHYVTAARELFGFLHTVPGFSELADPGWESRYLLGHAFHLLAEAACRLSDIKKRTSEADEEGLSPVELATGHYLYGVLFLEDAVSQLEKHGRIEHETTMSLLNS